MTYRLQDIVHETPRHFVLRVAKGFEVYRIGATAAMRCAIIGYTGQKGFERAVQEAVRRETEES